METTIPGFASLRGKIKSLLVSTAELRRDLTGNATATQVPLGVHLDEAVRVAERCAAARLNMSSKEIIGEADQAGTDLWNLASTLARDVPEGPVGESMKARILRARLLALYLIECSQGLAGATHRNMARLVMLALKTVRQCVDGGELHWATSILERAVRYRDELEKLAVGNGLDETTVSKYTCELYLTRMLLVWKQKNNPTMAMYMASKAAEVVLWPSFSAQRVAEDLAESLLKIGRELSDQKSYPTAIQWLQQAFDVLSNAEVLNLSEHGSELRMNAALNLARACIKSAAPANLEKARNIIDIMVKHWPSRSIVFVLKLDLTLAQSPENMESYHRIVLQMIDTIQLTKQTFAVVIKKIKVLLDKKAAGLARDCLDALINRRLLPLEKEDWVAQALVFRLAADIQGNASAASTIENLYTLLDTLAKKLSKPLSKIATGAAQGLLWKVSETLYLQQNYHMSSSWCRVALHMIFDKSGELNLAVILRRIILCCIKTKEYGTAAEVFNGMPEAARNAPRSRLLMFRIALRTSDEDLASDCLVSIAGHPDVDYRFLYACAMDAQDVGNRKLALRTMEYILSRLDTVPAVVSKLPIHLRVTIRLTMTEIEGVRNATPGIESLCRLYEKALKYAQRSRQRPHSAGGKYSFDTDELEWFSVNGYNLGLRGASEWSPVTALRIFKACVGFTELFPPDLPAAKQQEIKHRRLCLYYLCATLCTYIARLDSSLEGQLQHYLYARNHVQSFRVLYANWSGRSESETVDMQEKLDRLLCFDFEAATKLKNWEALEQLVDEAVSLNAPKSQALEQMAHIVTCRAGTAPHATILAILQRILDHKIVMRYDDMTKLAGWIRFLVRFAQEREQKVVERLIAQAIELARDRRAENLYPEDELYWLTVHAWNKSIDFNCASDIVTARRWSDFALSLAGMLKNDSTLRGIQAALLKAQT